MRARPWTVAWALALSGCYLVREPGPDAARMDAGGLLDAASSSRDRFVAEVGPRDVGPPDAYRYDGPMD